MEIEQIELIHAYFRLDKKIKIKERKIKTVRIGFYAQNFFGMTDYDDPMGVGRRGFRVESKVSSFVDYTQTLERSIRKLKRKKIHFNRYLSTLPIDRVKSLKRRYKVSFREIDDIQTLPSDNKVIDEILEIEEAIRFEFGDKKVHRYVQAETDESEELTIISDEEPSELDFKVMKVENMEFREDNSEEAFEAMTDLLGV